LWQLGLIKPHIKGEVFIYLRLFSFDYRVVMLPRWPDALGFTLYCALLESVFDNDNPSALSDDAAQLLTLLRCAQ